MTHKPTMYDVHKDAVLAAGLKPEHVLQDDIRPHGATHIEVTVLDVDEHTGDLVLLEGGRVRSHRQLVPIDTEHPWRGVRVELSEGERR